MREELKGFYAKYLKYEQVYLSDTTARLREAKKEPENELKILENELNKIRISLAQQEGDDPQKGELARLETDISGTRKQKDELSRGLGRIEGMIEYEERRIKKAKESHKEVEIVAYRDVKRIYR